MLNLTEQMRAIMAIEAVWILVGILLTGVTQASLLLWASVAFLAWSAYSGKLMGTAGADWLLEKVRPYLKRS